MAAVVCLALALLTFYGLARERTLALNVAEAQTQNLARVLEEHARQTLLRVHGRLVQVDSLLASVQGRRARLCLAPYTGSIAGLAPLRPLAGRH